VKVTPQIIAGFVGSVLRNRFDGATESPQWHHDAWNLCCTDAKYVALSAPRGHAKSTAITLGYGLSTLLFRERKFMILVSDTESQASLFLGTFKQELQENTDLIELFDLKKNEKGLVQFQKDTESDIIVEFNDGHKFRIIAKGAEQKLRGLIWNGSRPDIVLGDDMENDELVMNKERRAKMKRWFYGALMPVLSQNGIMRLVGTILHMDALLESFMPNPNDKQTVITGLKMFSKRRTLWKSIKWKAHNEDFSEILWPQRFSAQKFKDLKDDFTKQGMPDVYSQEYLNVPIDESSTYFKRADFLPIREDDKKKPLHYYVTADLAISEKERADYSVFIIAGVDEDKRIQLRNVIRDRMDGREIVDTLIAIQRLYEPVAVGIEDMQVSKSIGPFLNEEMLNTNTFLNIYPLKHGGKDKLTRSRSIQARMRANGVKFDKEADWYQPFEDECMRFPRDRHDDQVDAFAYLGLMLDKIVEAPTIKELEEEQYQDELADSELYDAGRNDTTGY
jgi:predicted phage terminase large subunit-like protein